MDDNDKPDPPFVAPGAAAQAAASKALFAALKAKRAANAAATSREFATKSVRGLRPVILDLFDSGATTEEVLAILQQALPTISLEDMQFALSKTRDRYRLNKPAAPPRPASGAAPANRPAPAQAPATKRHDPAAPAAMRPAPASPPASVAAKPTATNRLSNAEAAAAAVAKLGLKRPTWADGSDKRPNESEDEYIFRKNIETGPEERRKFIGEHNS